MTLGAGVAVTGGPAGAQTDFIALCKAVAELPVNQDMKSLLHCGW